MNSQTKFLISMLFIIVIILCVFLTRFYFDVTKNTENSTRDSRVESIVRSFGELQVFHSADGGCGLLGADLSILIEPDWIDILDVTNSLVLVSGRIDQKILIGGIDYEENVILPFVFSSVETLGNGFHIAAVAQDGRKIILDRNYQPVFQESFLSAEYHDSLITVQNEKKIFIYDAEETPPLLRSAEFSCNIAENLNLEWKISNQFYLSELTADDLSRINSCAENYIQMLRENNFRNLGEISVNEYFSTLVKNIVPEHAVFDKADHFAFYRRESGAYDFTFRTRYHVNSGTEPKQMEIHLFFRRSPENQMILTAADIAAVE